MTLVVLTAQDFSLVNASGGFLKHISLEFLYDNKFICALYNKKSVLLDIKSLVHIFFPLVS